MTEKSNMKPDKNSTAKKSKPSGNHRTVAEYDVSDEALAKSEQQVGELTVHLQRLQAEFENYKKRVDSERGELMGHAKEAVLSELLPALDNLDLAANHLPEDLADNAWAKGISYIGQQLNDKLAEMEVVKLNPIGQKFDHNQHEAIEYIESDKPENIVVEVITPGYKIGERVVRPARVKVSSGQADNTSKVIKENK
jgi:molecular chaperone GrpE